MMEESYIIQHQPANPEISRPHTFESALTYKQNNTDFPDELLEFNKITQIIANTRADIVVRHRKQISQKQIEPIDAIKSAINSTLNKLSIENVEHIKDELLSIQKSTSPEFMKLLAETVTRRASNEKNFVETYAKMCKYISLHKCTDGKYFGKYVSDVSFCQFNSYIQNGIDRDAKAAHDAINIDRQECVNFIKFIGWLYLHDLLQTNAIDTCVNKISDNIKTIEFGIEMITALIDVVAKKYFVVVDKITYIHTKLNKLLELDSLCKRDQILLELSLDKIKRVNVYVPPHLHA